MTPHNEKSGSVLFEGPQSKVKSTKNIDEYSMLTRIGNNSHMPSIGKQSPNSLIEQLYSQTGAKKSEVTGGKSQIH